MNFIKEDILNKHGIRFDSAPLTSIKAAMEDYAEYKTLTLIDKFAQYYTNQLAGKMRERDAWAQWLQFRKDNNI